MDCLLVLLRTPGGAQHQWTAILAALEHALQVQPIASTTIPIASLCLAFGNTLPTSGALLADRSHAPGGTRGGGGRRGGGKHFSLGFSLWLRQIF